MPHVVGWIVCSRNKYDINSCGLQFQPCSSPFGTRRLTLLVMLLPVCSNRSHPQLAVYHLTQSSHDAWKERVHKPRPQPLTRPRGISFCLPFKWRGKFWDKAECAGLKLLELLQVAVPVVQGVFCFNDECLILLQIWCCGLVLLNWCWFLIYLCTLKLIVWGGPMTYIVYQVASLVSSRESILGQQGLRLATLVTYALI